MRKLIFVAVTVLAAGFCFGQEISSTKKEKIFRLFELTQTQKKFEMGQVEGFKVGLELAPGAMDETQKAKVIKIGLEVIAQMMPWSKVREDIALVYSQAYSESELDEVIAVLSNDAVQLMLNKELEILGPSMKVAMKYGQEMVPELMKRMAEIQ